MEKVAGLQAIFMVLFVIVFVLVGVIALYIAWTTNNNLPTRANPNLFNQNAIKLMGSNDGGLSFSTLQIVNDNQHGMNFSARPEGRMSTPRLVVSQGTVPDALSGEPIRIGLVADGRERQGHESGTGLESDRHPIGVADDSTALIGSTTC